MNKELIEFPKEIIEKRILMIRGEKVMIDSDLARMYRVETRTLLQAIKRNADRFPSDFMFQLSDQEVSALKKYLVISNNENDQINQLDSSLRSQSVISNNEYIAYKDLDTEILKSISSNHGRGGRRYNPYVFTEHGIAMLSTVLSSPTAIAVSIQIVRTFISLRKMLISHEQLAKKLDGLEKKYDSKFSEVFQAIRFLMIPPDTKKKNLIGFGRNST